MYRYEKFDNSIRFDIEIIKVCEPFYKLYKRDRGSKGDSDGRKKLVFTKEMIFVWYASDFDSPGVKAGYSDDELIDYGRTFCGFPTGWEPDQPIADAINFYRAHNATEVQHAIDLMKALRTSNKIIGKIGDNMKAYYNQLDKLGLDNEEELNKRKVITEMLTGDITTLMKMAKDIPTAISVAKKAKETANNINATQRKIWGDSQNKGLGNRETRPFELNG